MKKANQPATVPNPMVAAQKKKPEEETELTPNVSAFRLSDMNGSLIVDSNTMRSEAAKSGNGSLMALILTHTNLRF